MLLPLHCAATTLGGNFIVFFSGAHGLGWSTENASGKKLAKRRCLFQLFFG
jgi:hypothetical protein